MTGDDMLVWRTRVDLAARYLLREIFEIDEDHVVSDPVMVSEVVTVPTDPHTFVVVLILRQRTWYVVLSSQRGFYTTPARLLKGKDTCQNKLQGPPFYHPLRFQISISSTGTNCCEWVSLQASIRQERSRNLR
jgi:hypothetical protein